MAGWIEINEMKWKFHKLCDLICWCMAFF